MSEDTSRIFFVDANEKGINKIEYSNDVSFMVRALLGIASFIASNIKIKDTDAPVPVSEFLKDLSEMARQVEQAGEGFVEQPLSH